MRRVALVAVDHRDADSEQRHLVDDDDQVVAVVTRRSWDAARGFTVDAIVWTPAAERLPAVVRQRIASSTLPALVAGLAQRGRL